MMRFSHALLAVLVGECLPAFGQVTLTERARTTLFAGEAIVNQQVLDLNGDGTDDLVLSLYNAASHRFRILALGIDGSQLWGVEGNTGPTETVWNGAVATSPQGLRLFTIEGSPDSVAATLTLRAYDLPTMTVLDSTVTYFPWIQPPTNGIGGSDIRNTLLYSSLTAIRQNDSVVVYAGFEPEIFLYDGRIDSSELITASFVGGRISGSQLIDGPYSVAAPNSPAGRLAVGRNYKSSVDDFESQIDTWTLYLITAFDSPPIPAYRSTSIVYAHGKDYRGAQIVGSFMEGIMANSPTGPILISRTQEYTYPHLKDTIFALSADLAGRNWAWEIAAAASPQPPNIPTVGLFAKTVMPNSADSVFLVCLYYPSGNLEIRTIDNGAVVSSQQMTINIVASVAGISDRRYFLSQDSSLIRLFSLDEINMPPAAPTNIVLQQNYPNPFNPSTSIRFSVPSDLHVTLKLYNSLGQEVKTITDTNYDKGWHEVEMDGTGLASGVYFYRIQAGGSALTRNLVVVH